MSKAKDSKSPDSEKVLLDLDESEGPGDGKTSKLEALQAVLKSYFERSPKVSIKMLSARSGVPYATLRRILQSEVNQIKDETIFKLLERVIPHREQIAFIREHYPSLERILEVMRNAHISSSDSLILYKKFSRMNPHNLLLKLALTRTGTTREVIERLAGEYGLAALEEMITSGFLLEDDKSIRANFALDGLNWNETREQVVIDLQHVTPDLKPDCSFVTHTFESVAPEALARIIAMSKKLLKDVEGIKTVEPGTVPFFLDIVVGTYDPTSVAPSLPEESEKIETSEELGKLSNKQVGASEYLNPD